MVLACIGLRALSMLTCFFPVISIFGCFHLCAATTRTDAELELRPTPDDPGFTYVFENDGTQLTDSQQEFQDNDKRSKKRQWYTMYPDYVPLRCRVQQTVSSSSAPNGSNPASGPIGERAASGGGSSVPSRTEASARATHSCITPTRARAEVAVRDTITVIDSDDENANTPERTGKRPEIYPEPERSEA